jgi:hypothetical protein
VDSTCWIITEGRAGRREPAGFDPEADRGTVREYRISELGRYLLNPAPIEIRKRLVGCEAHPVRGRLERLRARLPALGVRRRRRGAAPRASEVILSGFRLKLPAMQDPDLDRHFKRLSEELRGFDPFTRKLGRLDIARFPHLVGICEDFSGYSYLKLQGSVEEKIRYLNQHVGRDVRVTVHRANVADGLFDLRGFPAAAFNPANAYRLFSYSRDGQSTACVLGPLDNLDFRLTDPQALRDLSLVAQTLRANPDLQQAFDSCFLGRSRPMRLFINRQLEVDYSKANFPALYRDLFRSGEVAATSRNLVKPVLNTLQTAVSLSYMPAADAGDEKLLTQVSILHDLRALDPLRGSLPAVYAELNKRAFSSEAGRFYLLDSITGATHGE